MSTIDRFVCRTFYLDTNRINSRSKLPYMNQLEKWADDDVIELLLSDIARDEAIAGNDHLRERKANHYIYSETIISTNDDRLLLNKIAKILFPNGLQNDNQFNDVKIVFNALQDKSFLITNDGNSKTQPGGILGHKEELKKLGLNVFTDYEAVDQIKKLIQVRDERARNESKRYGTPLPDWVGKD